MGVMCHPRRTKVVVGYQDSETLISTVFFTPDGSIPGKTLETSRPLSECLLKKLSLNLRIHLTNVGQVVHVLHLIRGPLNSLTDREHPQ